MTQTALPISDHGTTAWTQGAGNSNGQWWDELKEGVPAHDGVSTYWVVNATGSTPRPIAVKLAAVDDPGRHTGHIIRVAAAKLFATAHTAALALYQGETLIASRDITTLQQGVFAIFSFDLTEEEAAAINDYGDLVLQFVANSGGTTPGFVLLTAMDAVFPDPPAGSVVALTDAALYEVALTDGALYTVQLEDGAL